MKGSIRKLKMGFQIRWLLANGRSSSGKIRYREIKRLAGKTKTAAKDKRDRVDGRVADGVPLMDAIETVLQTAWRPEQPPANSRSWAALWATYKDHPKGGARREQPEQREFVAGTILAAPWANLPIGTYGKAQVIEWTDELAATCADGTILNRLSLASSTFKWGQDRGTIADDVPNPFLLARRVVAGGVERMHRKAWTRDEATAVLANLREICPAAERLCAAALFSGWRLGELTGLSPNHIVEAPDARYIEFTPRRRSNKHMRPKRWYPPADFLGELLESHGASKSVLLFARPNGKPWRSPFILPLLCDAIDRAVRKDEMDPVTAYGDGDLLKRADFHSLRYTARSLLRDLGHDWQAIGEQLGQTTAGMASHYTTVSEPERMQLGSAVANALDR